jgi:casein kinase II subunit beta
MFVFKSAEPPPKTHRRRALFDPELHDCSNEWVYDLVRHNDWLCAVDETYMRDEFNLFGLSSLVDDYRNAHRLIIGDFYESSVGRSLEQQARTLYTFIHARFVLTVSGVRKIRPKFERQLFGTCPRIACHSQSLLPIGLSATPGESAVKTFCPCCEDLYDPGIDLDGAHFASGFPHFFVSVLKEDLAIEPLVPTNLAVFGVPLVHTRGIH